MPNLLYFCIYAITVNLLLIVIFILQRKIEKQKKIWKKFIVFVYDKYYPLGGLEDIKGNYDTLDEARKVVEAHWDNAYIVDRDTWEIIEHL